MGKVLARVQPGRDGWPRANLVTLAVAITYAVLTAFLNDLSRPLEWDEAVYLSSVSPRDVGMVWTPHRARGIAWLAWPIGVLETPIMAVRLWFLAINSALLALLTGVWWRVIGARTILAIAIFGTTWLAVFYGPEVAPNLPTALLLMIAFGALAAPSRPTTRLSLVLVGTAIALATVIRPTDALLWFVVMAVYIAVTYGLRSAQLLVSVAAVGVGLLPWLIETFVAFGGVAARLNAAAELVNVGPTDTAIQLLRLLEGPLVGPAPWNPISLPGAMWLTSLAVGSIVGLRSSIGSPFRGAALALIALVGVHLAAYVFALNALAPRFLTLPVLSLSILSARAFPSTDPGGTLSHRIRIFAAVLPLAFIGWQLAVVEIVQQGENVRRVETLEVGKALATDRSGGCRFQSDIGYPQIQFYSECQGSQLAQSSEEFRRLACGGDLRSSYVVLFYAESAPDEGLLSTASRVIRPVANEIRIIPVTRNLCGDT